MVAIEKEDVQVFYLRRGGRDVPSLWNAIGARGDTLMSTRNGSTILAAAFWVKGKAERSHRV